MTAAPARALCPPAERSARFRWGSRSIRPPAPSTSPPSAPTHEPGIVSVVDATRCCASIATITVGPNPQRLALDPALRTLYVPNQAVSDEPGSVSVVDTRSCNAQDTSGAARRPRGSPRDRQLRRGRRRAAPARLHRRLRQRDHLTHRRHDMQRLANRRKRPAAALRRDRLAPVDVVFDPTTRTLFADNVADLTVSVSTPSDSARPGRPVLASTRPQSTIGRGRSRPSRRCTWRGESARAGLLGAYAASAISSGRGPSTASRIRSDSRGSRSYASIPSARSRSRLSKYEGASAGILDRAALVERERSDDHVIAFGHQDAPGERTHSGHRGKAAERDRVVGGRGSDGVRVGGEHG